VSKSQQFLTLSSCKQNERLDDVQNDYFSRQSTQYQKAVNHLRSFLNQTPEAAFPTFDTQEHEPVPSRSAFAQFTNLEVRNKEMRKRAEFDLRLEKEMALIRATFRGFETQPNQNIKVRTSIRHKENIRFKK
jgi:hypothetical protein